MKLSKLKQNPRNPRIIRDDKFKKLVESLRSFPEMMEKRPMVCVTDIDGKLYPLGGNMRLRAIQELGMKDVPDSWVVLADDWTEEKRLEFTIKDNASFGEWDFDQLANEWDAAQLSEWGVDVPNADDFSDKNQEVDVDGLDGEMVIKLNYSEDDYWKVKEALSKVAATPEQAVYQLLNL